MVGILVSLWGGLFSGAMLVAGTVPWSLCILNKNDETRVKCAMERTASVHTLHMSKPVM